jgi:hypothetical protein
LDPFESCVLFSSSEFEVGGRVGGEAEAAAAWWSANFRMAFMAAWRRGWWVDLRVSEAMNEGVSETSL